jgi:homospermidine synthase
MDSFFFVGMGGVAFCLMELFNKERLYYKSKFVIIEPRTIDGLDKLLKGRDHIVHKTHLTESNYRSLLNGMNEKTLLVNLSVNVDSIMLLKFCKEKKAHYIDASLEQYEQMSHIDPEKVDRYSEFKKNNLYHQNIEAIHAVEGSRKTRIISCGMNPFGVNQFVKKALIEYGKTRGHKLVRGNYAKLAHDLGLKEIQVVEYDSQKLKVQARRDKFINTWSAIGFEEEASDNVMISLNNEDMLDMSQNYHLIKPTEKEAQKTHIRFLPIRGMNMMRESTTLDREGNPFSYSGMLIPHAELITLSEFLQYRGDAPTCMYVYRPCDEAIKSLHYFKENNYKNLPEWEVVRNKDVIQGFDSIGALLEFENGDRYGGWTVCDQEDVLRLGIKSNCTTLQVAGFMLASIKWIIFNKQKGINNAETIPHKFLFKHAEKYLGKIYFKKL